MNRKELEKEIADRILKGSKSMNDMMWIVKSVNKIIDHLETKLTERDKEIKRLNTILDDLRHEKQTATNLKRRQR
jgi:hypothetical protein